MIFDAEKSDYFLRKSYLSKSKLEYIYYKYKINDTPNTLQNTWIIMIIL